MSSLFNTLSGLGAPTASVDASSASLDESGPRADGNKIGKSGAHQNLQDPCYGYPAWLQIAGI